MNRRRFLNISAQLLGLGLSEAATPLAAALQPSEYAKTPSSREKAKVVIIGAGFGGATAAKYLQRWSEARIDVTLIEKNPKFISCPLSNLVIGGSTTLANLSFSFAELKKHGVRLIFDEATKIDAAKQLVHTLGNHSLAYDRLILSPGLDFLYETIPALSKRSDQEMVLHAWKAGPQTVSLRKQLVAMRNGENFIIHIPLSPYKCPPGPYERASQVAFYLKKHKPKSKVIILDANDKIQSKPALFKAFWEREYSDWLEYRPDSTLLDVDISTKTLKLEFEDVHGGVLNVIPPQQAGGIARQLGLNNLHGQRLCEVDFLTYASTIQPKIHILGDAIQAAPGMPKSGHMANQQAKVCAAAVLAMLAEQPINPNPMLVNACYSFVDNRQAIHVASVHHYDTQTKMMMPVKESGGLSEQPSLLEGQYAWDWARNIWADTLG